VLAIILRLVKTELERQMISETILEAYLSNCKIQRYHRIFLLLQKTSAMCLQYRLCV